jgi:peptide-methionine (R)-S-oxide reductase
LARTKKELCKRGNAVEDDPKSKTDAEWKAELSPEAYQVTRKHGTERAFTSPLNKEKREGTFTCVCCGEPLFASGTKFDSGTGWPSFYEPASEAAVSKHDDRSFFMKRTEVRCGRCDAHLGHVFPDGPRPTGLRYCINGVALNFKPKE